MDVKSSASRLVSKCRPPSSPPRITPPAKRLLTGSRILQGLDSEFGQPLEKTGVALEEVGLWPPPRGSSSGNLPRNFSPNSVLNDANLNSMASLSAPQVQTSAVNIKPKSKAFGRRRGKQPEGKETGPRYSYKDYPPAPARVYIRDEDEANELVSLLSGPLGFDLEWKVYWAARKLVSRRTAVVQLSSKSMVLVIQVSAMQRFPVELKKVIESPDIVKMGANILNDGRKLFNDYGIVARNLVELGGVAQQADTKFASIVGSKRQIVALAKVIHTYTHKTLDKGPVRSSNWEADLSEEQLEYAANDAHCALIVYQILMEKARANGVTLDPSKYTGEVQWTATSQPLAATDTLDSNATTDPAASSSSTAPTVSNSQASTASLDNEPDDDDAKSIHKSISCAIPGASRPRPVTHSLTPAAPTQRPQHLRAYNLWHHRGLNLDEICSTLRSPDNPLKHSTVISYVVEALKTDTALPYSRPKLLEFVQMEAGSWTRHKEWILNH